MDWLTVHVLGTPEVLWKGHSLRFRSRKALALLLYLIIEGGHHPRDTLIALLWPESDRALGGAALRNTLARLRQSLATAGEFILTDGTLVGIAADQPIDLDLHTVEMAIDRLSSSDGLEPLQLPVNLAGLDFLAGFSLPDAPEFDNWMAVQREWWHHRIDTLFSLLASRQVEVGAYHEAVETALQWTHHAPFNEAAHRRLIQAYALIGKRGAALQAYEHCQSLLAQELGVNPTSETRMLVERIRQDDTLARDSVLRSSGTRTVSYPAPSVVGLPLVGRSAEHGHLASTYQRVCQGVPQAVCLIGEAGVGKTRLADTFLEYASMDATPADILRGRAFEVGGRLPYQPVVDALRARMDRENAPDDLLPDIWLAELSQLLPELRERYPDLPLAMAGEPDFMRARLFEAVAVLTLRLAERQPLVLFLDDGQWADVGTLDLLHYLVRRWSSERARAMLLLTLRQENLLTLSALREWLADLGRDVSLTRVELAPLTRADVVQLVQAVDAAAEGQVVAQEGLGEWLLQETGGSPFFIAEMLRMFREDGELAGEAEWDDRFVIPVAATLQRIQATGRPPMPPGMREVLLVRLARLSEKAAALLLAGAVIGRPSSFKRLCQIARTDEFDGLPALEELLRSRLLLDTGNEDRPFTLAHDNIRDVVYTEAGATRRQLYHRQALLVLEQDDAPPAELAFHATAARLYERALHHTLLAGDAALSVHAFTDAVSYYSNALDLTSRAKATSAQLCHLCTQFGRALELKGQYGAAVDHYRAMAQLAEQKGDRPLALATLVAEGTIRATANALSDFALGEALGEQALALARELGDRSAEAKILWNLLNVYRMTKRTEKALLAGERSLALARELELHEQMAYAANDLVYAYCEAGDISRALTLAQTAIELWRELGNQPMLTDSLSSYANALALAGRYETALNIAGEALGIGQALQNQWAQSASLMSYGMVYGRQMAVDRALAAMDESIRLGQAAGSLGAQVSMCFVQAQLRLVLGDSVRARELAKRALEIATRNMPLFYPAAASTLALVAQAEGNLAEASKLLAGIPDDSVLDIFFNLPARETAACQQALLEMDYDRAHALSSAALAFLEEREVRMYIPDFLYFQGQALVGLGQLDRASEALESAVTMLQATGSRWYLWEIAALLAELAGARGDAPAADRWKATARDTIQVLVDQISDPRLCALFLNQTTVQRLREGTS